MAPTRKTPARATATPAHQTVSTIITDTAQPPINNPLPVEQNHQDERKNERARKRPHSAGDLVEDRSTTELQELVEKAVQKATSPLKTEIKALKETIERLSGYDSPSNMTGETTPEEAVNHLSWAQMAASQGQAGAAVPSPGQWQVVNRKNGRLGKNTQAVSNKTDNPKPLKGVSDGDRRLILQRPNGMEARHGPDLVVALNASLQNSGAAAHIRI
ncbi:hypothetical protein EX30DRAFT_351163 [Ascodesmis nigricans]|uniref:Uncharacterized protein n=1 Tax=Ascodesmis nigricans TaxID=341454 RepID=A0A4S2MS37_9PEZI|nr:hypothetical protein EX30DRAFT_351163 [Ascodesmis nigricans]